MGVVDNVEDTDVVDSGEFKLRTAKVSLATRLFLLLDGPSYRGGGAPVVAVVLVPPMLPILFNPLELVDAPVVFMLLLLVAAAAAATDADAWTDVAASVVVDEEDCCVDVVILCESSLCHLALL